MPLKLLVCWIVQVEKAPIVIKAGVKKEEAEELKKKLETGVRGIRASRAVCACGNACLLEL